MALQVIDFQNNQHRTRGLRFRYTGALYGGREAFGGRQAKRNLVTGGAPSSRHVELLANRGMGMHPPRRNVRQPRINFLADVDAVHEVIPRGCRWKASHEAEGLALHAASLRFCCRHARTLGAQIGVGKRPLPRGRSELRPYEAIGVGTGH